MKHLAPLLFALLLSQPARSASIEGPITIHYTKNAFDKEVFKREFGDAVKATCQWYAGEFFGKETVFAGIKVKNTGKAPAFFHYYVAFYDKDKNLVGAVGQGSFGQDGFQPGEETYLGSCLIHLPKDKYKQIASYQAIIYDLPPPSK